MHSAKVISSLLAGLNELERSGDIVITHPAPLELAERLCAGLIQEWSHEFLDEPIELAIDMGMKHAAKYIEKFFDVGANEAGFAVENFVRSLNKTRTPREVAELISHQGAEEIALGAYFCAHLQRGDYYGSDYLDWRKAHLANEHRS